jgi:hypothetical protein
MRDYLRLCKRRERKRKREKGRCEEAGVRARSAGTSRSRARSPAQVSAATWWRGGGGGRLLGQSGCIVACMYESTSAYSECFLMAILCRKVADNRPF